MPEIPVIIRQSDIHLVTLQTRMPFKYGIATMTRVPHAFVRVRAEINGRLTTGIAADLLPPKWFTKEPEKSIEEEVREMNRVVRHAAERSIGLKGANVFEVWKQMFDLQEAWAAAEKMPRLLAHFGTSLVERALIEAACRGMDRPFGELLRQNAFGMDLGMIHPELAGRAPGDLLPREPLDSIIVRHTVGLLDPLQDDQIPSHQRLEDGLPQSLEACIRFYGLKHFKIKVTGHPDHDFDRLQQIARVLEKEAPADFQFTLDGNEQFNSAKVFREFWLSLKGSTKLGEFLRHLCFLEQPLHRSMALEERAAELFSGLELLKGGAGVGAWAEAEPPIIIDESDAGLDSVRRALTLGYAGTSHKNCKGVFKGVANRCLLMSRQQDDPERRYLMSGEDLCTIGPVSVVQDLVVMAALGVSSVERNGHHYFPGLSMFPEAVQNSVLKAQGELYRKHPKGWPMLNIQDGELNVSSLHRAPFGVAFELDVEQFTPAGSYVF